MSTHIPDLDVARIRRYAEDRVPTHARHHVRNEITIRGASVTIVERRAPWRPEADPEWTSSPVAQLRWNASAATWTLYWRDRNTRWHPYPHTPRDHRRQRPARRDRTQHDRRLLGLTRSAPASVVFSAVTTGTPCSRRISASVGT